MTGPHPHSGKTHRDENFPVASLLIARRHRPMIRAFYDFVRAADDIADHLMLDPGDKLARLDQLEASLLDAGGRVPQGIRLRGALRARDLSPRHARDLLAAFRQDVTKNRYRDWNELIGYCSYSAVPVGRFVLDVHGEAKTTWPASDALCAALQIINHLQDCAADYRALDRVYLPLDVLARHGVSADALAAPRASPALRGCLRDLTERTAALLQKSCALPDEVADRRLAMEIAAIQRLAGRLITLLRERDPLSERVHLSRAVALTTGAAGALACLTRRLAGQASRRHRRQAQERIADER